MQKLFEDLNDLIILIIVLYVTLVFFGVWKYPTPRWKEKGDKVKNGEYGKMLKWALPAMIILLVLKIIITVTGH